MIVPVPDADKLTVPVPHLAALVPVGADGTAFIVCTGEVNLVFPGPTPPPLSPNQETSSYTTSKVRLLLPAAKTVPYVPLLFDA